jgi:hypothetical protein
MRFSSSFCLTVLSSFLNHNHDKNHHPRSSSALSTLVVLSVSSHLCSFSNLEETLVLEELFADVVPDTGVFFVAALVGVFGI